MREFSGPCAPFTHYCFLLLFTTRYALCYLRYAIFYILPATPISTAKTTNKNPKR